MQNTIIKNYQVISELGHGGMATVYLAHDNKFDTNVAVKLLNKEFVNNENIRKRFLAEARNMFKMSHPNIIKVTDLIDKEDTVAFVMEYIEGETLKEYLERKGKLSDAEIKDLFLQMLDAVGYVHKQKLVHRDIKPSNFMINREGQIKLMDFGIAKTTDSSAAEYTQTGTGVQMGTPMYMSPEQITETKSVTAQSDVYSLGVVLWQMATGQKPYDVRTLSSFHLQNKIVNENLPSASSVFDDIIQKATQKHPEERYINIQSFQVAIKHPTNSDDLESTILETKAKRVEETVVVQSKGNTNPISSHDTAPSSKNEPKKPNQEKKNSSKKWFYIGIGIILITVLLFLLKGQPEEKVVEEVPLNETNEFGHEVKAFSNANIRAVKIPGKDYYMGETKVTRAQFEVFVNATGYKTTAERKGFSYLWNEDIDGWFPKDGVNWRYNVSGIDQQPMNHPVIHVSWHDAVEFAKWADGRLPTEEEWEQAANGGRDGTTKPYAYAGSDNIDDVAWYRVNSGNTTHPVKGKKANDYGLYDMSGNVWEWTNSWYNNSNYNRVLRGGSWHNDTEDCLIINRYPDYPDYRSDIGFRLVFPYKKKI
jgi:serine/threonine protein kinase